MAETNFFINVKEKGAKKAEQNVKGLNKALGGLKSQAMLAAGAFLGAGALVAGIKSATDAFAEQELAERKLEQALGRTSQALLNQASALQKQSTSGDEAIIAQQAYLASIGLTEEQIKEMIPVALDLAAATGMTLEGAVRNTAKTLSGLTGELGESVPQLRNLTAEQLKAGEGVKVLGELFAGQAKTESEALTGRITQMTMAIGDAAQSIGELLAPAIVGIADTITFFAEGAQKFIDFLTGATLSSADALGIMSDLQHEIFMLENGFTKLSQNDIENRLAELGVVIDSAGMSLGNMSLQVEKNNKQQSEELRLVTLLVELHSKLAESSGDLGVEFAQFQLVQQEKLDKYEQEQKFIAALIEQNPQLAKSLDLVTDATKKQTKEKQQQEKAEISLANTTAAALGQFVGGAKTAARIQQVAATVDAYRTINKILADPKLIFPTNVLTAAAVGASAFANVMSISQSIGEFRAAATGMNEIVNKPTMILAGEAGAEQVSITPLDPAKNINGVQSDTINITFNSPIMSADHTEQVIIPQIQEALRRGATL